MDQRTQVLQLDFTHARRAGAVGSGLPVARRRRNGSNAVSCFEELHLPHAAVRFSQELLRPLLRGSMWSTVSGGSPQ